MSTNQDNKKTYSKYNHVALVTLFFICMIIQLALFTYLVLCSITASSIQSAIMLLFAAIISAIVMLSSGQWLLPILGMIVYQETPKSRASKLES